MATLTQEITTPDAVASTGKIDIGRGNHHTGLGC
jgi:hypothetical protein